MKVPRSFDGVPLSPACFPNWVHPTLNVTLTDAERLFVYLRQVGEAKLRQVCDDLHMTRTLDVERIVSAYPQWFVRMPGNALILNLDLPNRKMPFEPLEYPLPDLATRSARSTRKGSQRRWVN